VVAEGCRTRLLRDVALWAFVGGRGERGGSGGCCFVAAGGGNDLQPLSPRKRLLYALTDPIGRDAANVARAAYSLSSALYSRGALFYLLHLAALPRRFPATLLPAARL